MATTFASSPANVDGDGNGGSGDTGADGPPAFLPPADALAQVGQSLGRLGGISLSYQPSRFSGAGVGGPSADFTAFSTSRPPTNSPERPSVCRASFRVDCPDVLGEISLLPPWPSSSRSGR